jgi:hypothetical protein
MTHPKRKKRSSKAKRAKFERCVRKVKISSPHVNPWAVCHSTLDATKRRKRLKSTGRFLRK